MPRREQDRLQDVLDAVGRIEKYTRSGLPDRTRDDPVWDAILYNLAVIGEAVKDVSDATKDRAPHVDWRGAAKMRDFIIHRYFSADLAVVASTLESDIPSLKEGVERLLGELGD